MNKIESKNSQSDLSAYQLYLQHQKHAHYVHTTPKPYHKHKPTQNKPKEKFKVCICQGIFHNFNIKQGCFFGTDSKGYYVSFGSCKKDKVLVYRINNSRDNSIEWDIKEEYIQRGTTAFKIYEYLKTHSTHKINYGKEKIQFQAKVPIY